MASMRIVSIQAGLPREVEWEGRTVRTGIGKEPVTGRVRAAATGLEGDGQADPEVHGGIYKAIYAYPVENYGFWQAALGRERLSLGLFGENFTVEGMAEDAVHVGDVFRAGTVMVEVTQPRRPCYKLGLRLGLADFPKRFLESGRTGYYLRVLIEGEVGAGDPFERVRTDPAGITVRRIHELRFFDRQNVEGARKAASLPALAPSWREEFRKIVDEADRNRRGSAGCCDLPV